MIRQSDAGNLFEETKVTPEGMRRKANGPFAVRSLFLIERISDSCHHMEQ
jgi:hypothetical protein